MKKQITITIEKENVKFHSEGLSAFEMIGILYHYIEVIKKDKLKQENVKP
jgi:hypothetical protein